MFMPRWCYVTVFMSDCFKCRVESKQSTIFTPIFIFPWGVFLSEEDIRSVSCEGKQTSEVCRCELQCGCGSKASHSRWFSMILMALLLQQLHGWGWGWVAALLAAHRSSSAGWCHLRFFPACRLTVQRIMKTYDHKHRNKETATQ